jgi:nucleotide-binding universal stress UspA family protein
MFRSILVHLDDNERTAGRLDVGIRLAKTFGAHLVGAYLQPSYDIYPFVAEMLPADFVQERIDARTDAQQVAEARFRAAVEAAGVEAEWRAPAGDPYEVATIHARYADLTVLGQPERAAPDYSFANDLGHDVLVGSGRPVLFVPYAGAVERLGERILVAWKDTREAARALGDAMPLLRNAQEVRAVTVAPKDDEPIEDFIAEQQLRSTFALQGLKATVKRIVAPDISAGEFLLSQAADMSADMIVMGGYSHRRIRELVWGGVTRVMLRSMTVPVLMSH